MGLFAAKTTVILLIALGITRLMRRSSAASRHVVWSCALLAVLCLPLAGALLPALPLPWWPAGPTATELAIEAAETLPTQEIFEATPAPPMRDPVEARRAAALPLLWFVGSALVLGRLAVLAAARAGHGQAHRIERRLSAILDARQRRTGTSHVVALAALAGLSPTNDITAFLDTPADIAALSPEA